jgi:lysophospholipase L1-like esterase
MALAVAEARACPDPLRSSRVRRLIQVDRLWWIANMPNVIQRQPTVTAFPIQALLVTLSLLPRWPAGAQDAAPADRNAINTQARPGDMMADSPVTSPKEGAMPATYPPDVPAQNEPAEQDYYIFSSPCRSLAQIAEIQAAMPKGEFTPPAPDWRPLRCARQVLTEGGELRLLALGDSIVNDTMRSGWVAKLAEAYPKVRIQATVYVRGGGGCQHFKELNRIATNVIPRRPNLVFIGGISQRDLESIREVIHQLRAGLPEVEILLATGAFGTADPRAPEALAKAPHSGTGAYGRALKNLAAEEGCAYLDMTTPWAEYIRSARLHPHLFYRDVVHANEYGEQILSKILMAFWTAAEPAPSKVRGATWFPPQFPQLPLTRLMDTPLRDTSICLGPNGGYYLTGTVEPFWGFNAGIKLWKSPDLAHWTALGFVWKYGASPWHEKYLEAKKPLWAPEVHDLKGTFWLTYSMPGWDGTAKTSGCGLLKSTTGKPEGPYADVQPAERIGDEIDASLFEDDDGVVYFLWHSGKIARMETAMNGLAEPYHWLKTTASDPNPKHHSGLCAGIFGKGSFDHVGYEGMFLFKREGRYYLSCAENFDGRYSCAVATATNIYGPYGQRYEAIPHAGHNTFFQDSSGQWWSTYFGSDDTAPWRERPGMLPITFDSKGRVGF